MKTLVYDILIRQVIRRAGEEWFDLDYVTSWNRHKEMTIAIFMFHWQDESGYLVLDNFVSNEVEESVQLLQSVIDQADAVVGFNSLKFADKVCQENGLHIRTTYDLLEQIRASVTDSNGGNLLGGGYSTAKLVGANSLPPFDYEQASKQWQSGNRGFAIDSCKAQIGALKSLLDLGLAGELIDPNTKKKLTIKPLPCLARRC